MRCPLRTSRGPGKRKARRRLFTSPRTRLVAAAVVLVALASVLTLQGIGKNASLNQQVSRIARPYEFSILGWELGSLQEWNPLQNKTPATKDEVLRYFSLNGQIGALQAKIEEVQAGNTDGDVAVLSSLWNAAEDEKSSLEPAVRAAITRQITRTLAAEGIQSTFLDIDLNFPPVSFRLAAPPHTLAVSPRDRIYLQQSILLDQTIQPSQVNSIESQVDALGVSSVVLDIGGFGGTYPTFVDDGSDLRPTIETAIHEWLHQYLAFTPLGFRYVLHLLGFRSDPDIATMNETVANTASKELTSTLLREYYAQPIVDAPPAGPETFDFDREMRQARKTVDTYLARGDISGAEAFMEQERLYLLTKGYYIRKLNQAYFAFNDQYADTPASTNPIGGELEQLRAKSPTLGAFLEQVSRMTGRQELTASIK